MAGGQFGYNWQSPNSNLVIGLEADLDWLDSDGTNTCLAVFGPLRFSQLPRTTHHDGDLTARVGWAYGQSNHSLVYIKVGAAFVRNQVDISTNATADFVGLLLLRQVQAYTEVGWTIGAGVEHAITPAWSVKVEYDYSDLGGEMSRRRTALFNPFQETPFTYFLTPAGTTRVSQNFQQVNLGLNYKFGMDPSAGWGSAPSAFRSRRLICRRIRLGIRGGRALLVQQWQIPKRFGSTANPALANILNSRLTYNTTANRANCSAGSETPQNVFVKGNIGVGSLFGGQ